jgi:hypothetical protein
MAPADNPKRCSVWTMAEVPKLWGALAREARLSSGGGGVVCMRHIFISNEIWAIHFGRHFAWFKFEACFTV